MVQLEGTKRWASVRLRVLILLQSWSGHTDWLWRWQWMDSDCVWLGNVCFWPMTTMARTKANSRKRAPSVSCHIIIIICDRMVRRQNFILFLFRFVFRMLRNIVNDCVGVFAWQQLPTNEVTLLVRVDENPDRKVWTSEEIWCEIDETC